MHKHISSVFATIHNQWTRKIRIDAADYLVCETAWDMLLENSSGRLCTSIHSLCDIYFFTDWLQYGLKIRIYHKRC